MSLDAVVKRLSAAGLDLTPNLLLDAIWLALQPGLTLGDDAAPRPIPIVPPIEDPIEIEKRKTRGTTPVTPPPDSGAGAGPADTATEASVFAGPAASSETIKASAIRIPAGAALPGKLALARAMRPFRARRPSPNALELDEERTVELTADRGGNLELKFRPRSDRWYEAIVVVEEAPSMDVWHETISELVEMLRDTGAFRDVSTRTLAFVAVKPPKGGPDQMVPMLSSGPNGRVPAGSLESERARRLIFFATHGISARWRDASLASVLQGWTKTASVVILHLLPTHLWRQTALGEPRGQVRAGEAGAPTAHLQSERFEWDLSLSANEKVVSVPVIPLDPAACLSWAQMQMGRGRRAAAMLIPTTPPSAAAVAAAAAEQAANKLSVADQVAQFRSYASPLAFRLAVYLAPGPFTLPVARLIQAARFGNAAQQSHLAEVLLSGLFYRVTRADSQVAPDWVQYDVVAEEAREILLRSLREEDAQHIASILQQHVNRYIAETYGKPADFRALVRDERGQFELPDWAQPFATIGEAILKLHPTAGTIVPSPQPQPQPAPPPPPPSPAPQSESPKPFTPSLPDPIVVGPPLRPWVLCVGTGGRIDDELRAFAQDLGGQLAEREYNLIIGGWDGVDDALAEGFARVVRERGASHEEIVRGGGLLQGRLVQVIAPGDKPLRPFLVEPVMAETERQYETETIARADVVVLVGGRGYTATAGRRALEMGVPVVPVAAFGGDAAEIFSEMQRLEYATDPSLEHLGRHLARATQLVVESALRPEAALPRAARAYLKARDLALADYINRRMTSWGVVPLDIADKVGDGPEYDALRACVQRLRPTREGIAAIFEALNRSTEYRIADLNLMWLRLMAIRAAFADAGVRASLSPQLETVTRSLYNRLDDETSHGGMPGRLKTALAGPFGRLMGLIKAAEAARNPSASAGAVPRRNREVLDDDTTLSCLHDLDPGWRAAGLGRQVADPSIALLSATLGATRFESTYELHVDLCLEALASLAKSAPVSEVGPEDRQAIEQMLQRHTLHPEVRPIRAWLEGEGTTPAPAASGARDAAAQGWALADRWAAFVAEYEQLRETTAGPERTAAMTSAVNKMLGAVRATPPDEMRAVSRNWTADLRRGWRLAGYVVAHEIGDETDIAPLCLSLQMFQATTSRRSKGASDNRPFSEYWGLQALQQVLNRTPVLSRSQIEAIQALKGVAPPDTDRARTWLEIERRLAAEDARQTASASAPSSSEEAQAPRVFINYRRDDTGEVAKSLTTELEQRFGTKALFVDKSVPPGESWRTAMREAIQRSTVFLVLIGKSWLRGRGMWPARLDNPGDLVRQEIEFALTNNKVVVPVLVDEVSFPDSSQLPESLRDIVRWQAISLHSETWAKDIEVVVKVLESNGFRLQEPPATSLREQSDLAAARTNYAESLAVMRRLAEHDPSNADLQRDLSLNLDRVGDTLREQGDLGGALAVYRESLEVRRRLTEADPSNLEWQRDLSVSLDSVGQLLHYQGDLPGALAHYSESLALIRHLVETDPSSMVWQRDLGVSLDRVGDALRDQGDPAGALANYEESLAVRRRLAEIDPSNAVWQRDLSASLDRVGDALRLQGNLAGALERYHESLAVRRRLAAPDSSPGLQRDLGVSLHNVGSVLRAQGDLAGALASFHESLAVTRRLAEIDPSNLGWQRDLSVNLVRLSEVYGQQGDRMKAMPFAEESVTIYERLAAVDPSNVAWQRDLTVSRALVARLRGGDAP
jgi:tetratricopeptide (TPR) repeat protein